MEDRVLTKNAYSGMFIVLALWSSIPYFLPPNLSLLVFGKANFFYNIIYIIVCTVASLSISLNKKCGFLTGIAAILMTIGYLALEQYKAETTNILQLSTLITMIVVLAVFSKIFKPVPTVRRARLSTLELKLDTSF